MKESVVFLLMVIVLVVALAIGLVIWAILANGSCYPFKKGGFGPDNGYDQTRMELVKKKGKKR